MRQFVGGLAGWVIDTRGVSWLQSRNGSGFESPPSLRHDFLPQTTIVYDPGSLMVAVGALSVRIALAKRSRSEDRQLLADIVDLVAALFRALPFSRPWSICCLRIGPVVGADFFGAVMPARGKQLASLEALRASAGSGLLQRVGIRLARRTDRAI